MGLKTMVMLDLYYLLFRLWDCVFSLPLIVVMCSVNSRNVFQSIYSSSLHFPFPLSILCDVLCVYICTWVIQFTLLTLPLLYNLKPRYLDKYRIVNSF